LDDLRQAFLGEPTILRVHKFAAQTYMIREIARTQLIVDPQFRSQLMGLRRKLYLGKLDFSQVLGTIQKKPCQKHLQNRQKNQRTNHQSRQTNQNQTQKNKNTRKKSTPRRFESAGMTYLTP
jgi:hypothetical protein